MTTTDKEQKQKFFFQNLKQNLNQLETAKTFLEKNKSLFKIMTIIENKKEEFNKNSEVTEKNNFKYENSEIYLSFQKLFESSDNNFANLKKEILLLKKVLSQYIFFRELITEKEKEEMTKNINDDEFRNYIKNLKKDEKIKKEEKFKPMIFDLSI